jgi:HAD superfamily hydrolase (TIGR01509 family)
MELKAVLFDLWGTLIIDPEARARPRQEWRAENVKAILARHDLDLPLEQVDASLYKAGAALSELHDDGIDVDARGRVGLFLQQLEPDVAHLVPDDAWPPLQEAITTMHPTFRPEVNEGAVDLLRRIKAMGLGTALISNAGFTTAPNLRKMLDADGMLRYLDVLMFSDELEVAKPERRIFEAALEGLGVTAGEAAFVGDSPHNDVHGAISAGLYAVQIGNRVYSLQTGYTEHPGVTPNARIDRLEELLPALQRDWQVRAP